MHDAASAQDIGRPASREQGPARVDVWSLVVSGAEPGARDFDAGLSAEEKTRADRFWRPADRARYVLARAGLRAVLRQCFGIEGASQRFVRGPGGKPRLAADVERRALHFNLSHSGDVILIAVSLDVEVGIDVEEIVPLPDRDVVPLLCSSEEIAFLEALSEPQRLRCIYRLWTIKEAVVKAHGVGLQGDLADISVTLREEGDSRIGYASASAEGCFVQELDVGAGYAAALASVTRGAVVHRWAVSVQDGRLVLPPSSV